jgi:hypothetical protein
MRIDHRRRNICVPKEFLHGPDVAARLEQVRREGVPERILTLLMNLPQPRFTTATIRSTANR